MSSWRGLELGLHSWLKIRVERFKGRPEQGSPLFFRMLPLFCGRRSFYGCFPQLHWFPQLRILFVLVSCIYLELGTRKSPLFIPGSPFSDTRKSFLAYREVPAELLISTVSCELESNSRTKRNIPGSPLLPHPTWREEVPNVSRHWVMQPRTLGRTVPRARIPTSPYESGTAITGRPKHTRKSPACAGRFPKIYRPVLSGEMTVICLRADSTPSNM